MSRGVLALTTAVARRARDGDAGGRVLFARPDTAHVGLRGLVVSVQSAALAWAPNSVLVSPAVDLSPWSAGDAVRLHGGGLASPGLSLTWSGEHPVLDLSVTAGVCGDRADALLTLLLPVVVPDLGKQECLVCAVAAVTGLPAGPGVGRHLHALSDRSARRPVEAATIEALVGLGRGLTPAADDLLCGLMVTQRALGVRHIDALSPGGYLSGPVVEARTTSLSATWLRLAAAGQTIAPLLRLLHQTPGSRAWWQAVEALRGVGSSTGGALLSGTTLAIIGAVCNPVRFGRLCLR